MRSDAARALTTMAIWAAVAGVLVTIRLGGSASIVAQMAVGMTACLSVAAAVSTVAIWRSPPEPKARHREV